MHPWVWGRMRLYGVQGTQSVRAEDEPETRPIIGEEGSTLRLTTTERRLKPRTSPESQPRLGFTGASKKFCPSSFFGRICLLRDAPPKIRHMSLGRLALTRKLPARQVECELRQHGRNTTEVGRAGSTPRFYFSPP